MKVLINRLPRRNQPWGGGAQFVNAFHDHMPKLGVELVQHLSDHPDVAFVFHPDGEGTPSFEEIAEHRKKNPNMKIVLRVNECDKRKGTTGVDELWRKMIDWSDLTIYVSSWMKNYFEDGGGADFRTWNPVTIVNGVDRSRFRRIPKISGDNKKVNIVCAHWSDNDFKGADTYAFLDEFVGSNPDYTFTYIGRTKVKFNHSYHRAPLPPEELAAELSKYDVCVNGTYWDPAPNAVIESICAGLPTYVHRDGGGAVDLAGTDHVYQDFDHLRRILLSKDFTPNKDPFKSWDEVMDDVYNEMVKL